jgi:hypothetical protein
MKRLTDERFASIPAMIEQGFSKAEIAAMWGVKISTLQVQCSRRGVSLRKGGHLLPRRQLSLPDAPLTLTNTALMALRTAARAMGVDEARLASVLLETITKDDLYKAVLDVEEAA